jgi:MFS family permease
MLAVFWPLGGSIASALAWLIIPAQCSFVKCGWQPFFFVIGALQLLFLVCAAAFVPESPRWLSLRGRHKDADRVLQQCFNMDSLQISTSKLIDDEGDKEKGGKKTDRPGVWALFHPVLRRSTTMLW